MKHVTFMKLCMVYGVFCYILCMCIIKKDRHLVSNRLLYFAIMIHFKNCTFFKLKVKFLKAHGTDVGCLRR